MADEWIEVCTERGARTSTWKRKQDIHRDGDWHLAVHVWILTPDGHVLLQRRSHDKENHPDLWDVSFAGHVSAGESVIESAIREGFEELGLALHQSEFEHLATSRQSDVLNEGSYRDNEIHEIFVVRRPVLLEQLVLQKEEVADARLVSLDELEQLREGPSLVPHPDHYEIVLPILRKLLQREG